MSTSKAVSNIKSPPSHLSINENSSGRKGHSPLALHSLQSDSFSEESERFNAQLTTIEDKNTKAACLPLGEQTKEAPLRFKRKTNIRNYKLYQGKTVFFCGGRLLTSRALWAFSLSLFLLIAPSVLFFIFTCPWVWHNVSPAGPILYAYMLVLTFVSMLKTSWTDPGIIPRNLDKIPSYKPNQMESTYGYPYSSMSSQSLPLPKEVIINQTSVRLKYCDTCCIYRPPRASHCRQCDNCNEDHHCIWLNNCIGKRNYRTFFTFVIGSTLMCLYVIGFSLAHVITIYREAEDGYFLNAIRLEPISFFDAVFCAFLLLPVGSLALYHCFLIMKGVTTHEQLRYNLGMLSKEDRIYTTHNPFMNMILTICRPHTKSYLARRKYAEEIYDMDSNVPNNNNKSNNTNTANTTTATTTTNINSIPTTSTSNYVNNKDADPTKMAYSSLIENTNTNTNTTTTTTTTTTTSITNISNLPLHST